MKKLFMKLIIFGGLNFCVILLFLLISASEKFRMPITELTQSKEYVYENFGANEIIPYIERVQEKNSYTKLIIGDSVCNQIFERYYGEDDEYCICGTNQAVTIAGQYILAEEFVKSHENITDIYLIVIMDSLTSGYNAQFGYQYAVMPFVETDTIDALDEDTQKEIAGMYGRIFCKKEVVEIIHKSPLCMKLYLNALAQKDQTFPRKQQGIISDLTYQYLAKLKELCDKEGIRFHLIPGPHADSDDQHIRVEQVRREAEEKGDLHGIGEYLDQITFYPEGIFRDRVHFDEDKLEDNFFDDLSRSLLTGTNTDSN